MRILGAQGANSRDCRQAWESTEGAFHGLDDGNVMINSLDQEGPRS